jgi:hypothetical protein
LVLTDIHAFNSQHVSVKGLAKVSISINVSNMMLSEGQQVAKTAVNIEGDNAEVVMESGGLVIILRGDQLLYPSPEDFHCQKKRLPCLSTRGELQLNLGDLIFWVHPLSPKWKYKPTDFLGVFAGQDFNEGLLSEFIKHNTKAWEVSIIVAKVANLGEPESHKDFTWIPMPQVGSDEDSEVATIDISDFLNMIQNRNPHPTNWMPPMGGNPMVEPSRHGLDHVDLSESSDSEDFSSGSSHNPSLNRNKEEDRHIRSKLQSRERKRNDGNDICRKKQIGRPTGGNLEGLTTLSPPPVMQGQDIVASTDIPSYQMKNE